MKAEKRREGRKIRKQRRAFRQLGASIMAMGEGIRRLGRIARHSAQTFETFMKKATDE